MSQGVRTRPQAGWSSWIPFQPATYAGDRVPQVSAALLAAIDAAVRSAVRDSRITTVITLDDELVIHLYEYQSATWIPHPTDQSLHRCPRRGGRVGHARRRGRTAS